MQVLDQPNYYILETFDDTHTPMLILYRSRFANPGVRRPWLVSSVEDIFELSKCRGWDEQYGADTVRELAIEFVNKRYGEDDHE